MGFHIPRREEVLSPTGGCMEACPGVGLQRLSRCEVQAEAAHLLQDISQPGGVQLEVGRAWVGLDVPHSEETLPTTRGGVHLAVPSWASACVTVTVEGLGTGQNGRLGLAVVLHVSARRRGIVQGARAPVPLKGGRGAKEIILAPWATPGGLVAGMAGEATVSKKAGPSLPVDHLLAEGVAEPHEALTRGGLRLPTRPWGDLAYPQDFPLIGPVWKTGPKVIPGPIQDFWTTGAWVCPGPWVRLHISHGEEGRPSARSEEAWPVVEVLCNTPRPPGVPSVKFAPPLPVLLQPRTYRQGGARGGRARVGLTPFTGWDTGPVDGVGR
jgi:hypothetical protein